MLVMLILDDKPGSRVAYLSLCQHQELSMLGSAKGYPNGLVYIEAHLDVVVFEGCAIQLTIVSER